MRGNGATCNRDDTLTSQQIDDDQLWVGEFKATGALVVFDPQLQVGAEGHVQLYSLNAQKVRDFDRRDVRVMLATAPVAQRTIALQHYANWRAASLQDYLREVSIPQAAQSPTAVEDAPKIPRWRYKRPPPRKPRGSPSSNVILGSQAALALLGAVNPFLGIGAFIGGLLWSKSLEKNEVAKDTETLFRWREERIEIYEEYLQSDTWLRKRESVIRRANGICEHQGCNARVEEVHHKRYPQRLGDEPLDWLEGLCARHHDERHMGKKSYDE